MKKYLITIIILLLATASILARPPRAEDPKIDRPTGLAQSASPFTIDQVAQNTGNIVLTNFNWGYLGGYMYNLPSGEYPRNSGRNYLAEALYWMGAVTASGDTLVANSYDDFEAIPMPFDGEDQYKIYSSNDPERYYGYDETDTVGLSAGRPAFGWRIWNSDAASYDYNESYNSLSASYVPTGPTSLQDTHYRFNDAAMGSPLLGLEMTQTIYQWNYCYNEDFMFVKLDITNTSDEDYAEFAFGLYIDIDVGGEDGLGGNGNTEDMVAYDTAQNIAYTYDVVGTDPGWGPTVKTGVMGTKLLETPLDIGMTAFRTDSWSLLPGDDPERFAFINSEQFDAPLPPTDQFYIQCVRGINLPAGATVNVVYAIIAGDDSTDFMNNAERAQQIYDNNFVGPEPPNTPMLSARASDGKVYLAWTDTSEVTIDPMSGENDFVGYKLYRSDNQGKTWGEPVYKTGNNCLDMDYETVASYFVNTPGDPIPHTYIDTDLHNGVEYWYCLTAFDKGDTTLGVDALQSGFGIAGQVSNVIAVTPVNNPSGYYEATETIVHNYTGTEEPSAGSVEALIYDNNALMGAEYKVIFEDQPDTTYWSLINTTTGDTIIHDQGLVNADVGFYPTAEGLQVVVKNADKVASSYGQTGFATAGDTTLQVAGFYGIGLNVLFETDDLDFGDQHFRSNYEIRYTGDSTLASWILDGYYGSENLYWVPFEIWNTSTNQRVSLAVYDFLGNGVWENYDLLEIVNYPYDSTAAVTDMAFPYYYTWMFGFDETVYNPQVGDVFTIKGAPLNGPDDNFTFKVDGVNKSAAANELDNIRVVPNPYFVKYSSLVEINEGESVLEFQQIPDECTIRIYNLAGDLIQTIEHNDGTGTARWNLLTENNHQIASGTYFYHVESPYGEHMGRFAVIK